MAAAPITMQCLNCAGRLKVGPEVNRFACAYCGREYLVLRAGADARLERLNPPRRPLIDFCRVAASGI